MTISGYITINLSECPWHGDAGTLSVFCHLLSAVSGEGMVTTSQRELSELCGLSRQTVRTALKKLQLTNYLTIKVTNSSTELTINGIDSYNCKKNDANQPINQASNQPEKESTKERGINKKRITVSNETSKEKKDDALMGYVSAEWKPIFQSWLDYKKARRESYKTEQSLKLCFRKLENLSGNNPQRARAMIEEAMANNWAGFFAHNGNGNERTNRFDSTIGRQGDFSSDI